MDLGLKGKVALVTGSSRGIGCGIAHYLAGEGARVVLTARGEEDLVTAVESIRAEGGVAVGFQQDLRRKKAPDRLLEKALREFGTIDILVNNVGGNRRGDFLDTSDRDWDDIMDLNLLSHVRLTRTILAEMKDRGRGSVIFISSIFGMESGGPGLSIYNTSKTALLSLSKVLASEMAPYGIRVNAIAPGSIRFPGGSWDRRCREQPEEMAEFVRDNLPLGRFGTVEEVAAAVAFLVSDHASLITGTCLNVDGGQSRAIF